MIPLPRFPASTVRLLSYCQILVGVTAFALEATFFGFTVKFRAFDGYLTGGGGFICGVSLVITGALGLRAVRKPTLCNITSDMVLSFVSAILSFGVILPTSVGVHLTRRPYANPIALALFATQLTLGLMSLLLSVVTAGLTCRAVCYICNRTYGQDQEGPVGATGGTSASAPGQTKTANAQDYQGYVLPPNYQDVEMPGGGGDKQDQKPRY